MLTRKLRAQLKAALMPAEEAKDVKSAPPSKKENAPDVKLPAGIKLNDYKVVLVPKQTGGAAVLPPRGIHLFQTAFCNCFLVAPKNVGKTTIVYNIIKECCSKATVIYLFCSTVNHDESWIAITEWAKTKGINIVEYSSIISESGENHLTKLMESIIAEADESSSSDDEEELVYDDDDATEQPTGTWVKKAKPKKREPKPKFTEIERMFIFDDIGKKALNSPALAQLLKTNRHFKSKCIISTQYVKDIPPDARKNIDYWLLFPHLTSSVVAIALEGSGLSFGGKDEKEDIARLYELYQKTATIEHDAKGDVTAVNFLYIDVKRAKFRSNFNVELPMKTIGKASS